MSRIAYVNGLYLDYHRAAVHVEDRGYQFADGVYEVVAINGGRMVDRDRHLDRLERSLDALRIPLPMSRPAFTIVMNQVLRRNRLQDGMLYIQITRGVAPRDHVFPGHPRPSVVITARRLRHGNDALAEAGISVITIPDIRWKRCDIKSVSLLPNVLGKQMARDAGAFEAWQVDQDGFITEGTSSNAWIIDDHRRLITRQADQAILEGVTRRAILDLAQSHGLEPVERAFTRDQALSAREAFITSTTTFVLPVVRIDDEAVGDGRPGPFSRKLRQDYLAYMAGNRPFAAREGSEQSPGERS